MLREPKHQETTAYWYVRRCESRGDQNGTHDTADAVAGDICRRQGKSFKTKSVREVLEVHVQKSSPDVQKTVFKKTADMHPDADSDDVFATTDSEFAVSSGEAADSWASARDTTIAVATAVSQSVGDAQLLGIAKYSATTAAELTESLRESGMTTTVATTVACCDAETGDVILLLQEQEHSVLKRSEPFPVGTVCDMELEITHLDGWKLQVTISLGEIVQPMMQALDPLGTMTFSVADRRPQVFNIRVMARMRTSRHR